MTRFSENGPQKCVNDFRVWCLLFFHQSQVSQPSHNINNLYCLPQICQIESLKTEGERTFLYTATCGGVIYDMSVYVCVVVHVDGNSHS